MKKLFSILLVLFAFIASAQDPSPLPSITVKKLIAPNNPTFYYNTVDSALWVFKGETGWLRIATNQQLIKYYVPYIGASKNVNLGIYTITARGQRLPLFNGACQISTLTDHGNGTVTIGNGDYHLASDITGHDSKIYSLTGGTFTMTDLSQNYIVADYNSGNPLIKVITDVTLINETTIVPIYSIFRNGNFLHTQNWDALGLALANKVHQSIVKTQRYRRESGLALSESGTRNLNLTSSIVWTGAVPITLDAVATATDNLYLWYHTGGVWTQTVVTQYNNTQYDNGTNLTDLLPNRYAVNWIFRGVESQKHLYAVLGTGNYTEPQAISATLPAIPVAISSHAVLVAKLIVQKNSATAFSIQSAFDTQFGLSAIQAHGDLTGRDVVDSHPAGAISFTPTGTYTATNVADAFAQIDVKTPDRSVTNEIQAPTRVGDLIGLTQTSTTIDISDKAPASGSGNYIWNGTSPQTGNYNITGNGVLGGSIQATTGKFTNLTDGYIPYHISDASGLGNSPIYTDGNNVAIGTASSPYRLTVANSRGGTGNDGLYFYNTAISSVLGGRFLFNSFSGYGINALILQEYNNSDAFQSNIMAFQNYSGNVGIGYVSGTEITNNKLAVNGSGYFNGNINSTGYLLNGNNLHSSLSTGYLPYWDGGKFLNSTAYYDNTTLSIGGTGLGSQFGVVSNVSGYRVARILNSSSGAATNGTFQIVTANAGGSALDIGHWNSTSNDWLFRAYNNVSRANDANVNDVGSVIKFAIRGDGEVFMYNFSSTNPRLLSSSSTGQLTPIADGTNGQVLTTNGSGVYSFTTPSSGYGYWTYGADGATFGDVSSHQIFYTSSGTGIRNTEYTSASGGGVTVNLDLGALTTISNHTASYYFPVAASSGSGATQAKVTIASIEGLIGTTAGTADRLVKRDGSGDAYAHNFILSSDRRLKKNIVNLSNTDWTNKIEFKQFKFKDDPKEKIQFGVIAQDIEKIAPELVSTDADGNKAVAYIDMLIAKVAEMDKQLKELQQKVEDLEFINEGQKELLNMKKSKRHAK